MSADSWTEGDIAALLSQGGQTGPVGRTVDLMLSGWGYNYHAPLAKARENDQIVRRLASAALTQAQDRLRRLEADYRQAKVPPPSRQKPFPTQEVQELLGQLHRVNAAVKEFIAALDSMESSLVDHQSKRLRNEQEYLVKLTLADIQLVLAAQSVRDGAGRLSLSDIGTVNGPKVLDPLLDEFSRRLRDRRATVVGYGH